MGAMMDSPQAPAELTDGDRELLEFERSNWGAMANKESAVRERFSLSLARYYQRVYTICRSPEALRYDATLVRAIEEAAQMRETVTRHTKEGGH
jgi:hypothetical protein